MPTPDRETATTGATTVWRGRIVAMEVLANGYEVARHAPAVAVLVERTSDGFVLGVEQARPAIDARTWELPAGLIDPGEAPADAAARELAEETQRCGVLTYVTRLYVSPGFTDEIVHLFEATDVEPCDGVPDEGEDLRVAWRDPRAAWDAVADGTLATSGVTLLGLQRVLARRGDAA